VIGQCSNFHGINSTVEIGWEIFWIRNTPAMGIGRKKLRIGKKYPFHQPIRRQHSYIRWNYIQIYPVSEGYLRKRPVERRGIFPEPRSGAGNFSCSRNRYFSQITLTNRIYLQTVKQWHSSSIVDWNQGTIQCFLFSPFKLIL
jgi:hypothetical protein